MATRSVTSSETPPVQARGGGCAVAPSQAVGGPP